MQNGEARRPATNTRRQTARRCACGARVSSGVSAFPAGLGPLTSQRGFTLIEVLAALVIVSLGMLGVIEAVTQTASNGVYLRDKTIAHWVAMNQLTKVRLDTRPPKVEKTSDEIEMAQRRWRWTMTVIQTPVASVRRIDISVTPAEADKDSSLASVTGFFGSSISPGVQPVFWSGQGAGGRGNPGVPVTPGTPGTDQQPQPTAPPVTPPPAGDGNVDAGSGVR